MSGYQVKTIERMLNSKLNDFAKTFSDNQKLTELFHDNAIVTGGSIASLLLGDEPNDYDIYFKTKNAAFEFAQFFCEKYDIEVTNSSDRVKVDLPGGVYSKKTNEEDEAYNVLLISQNAITLSNGIQLIFRFYGKPRQIHENFDFVHATGVYDFKKNKLKVNNKMLLSLMSKTLKYSGSLYPIASLFRIQKFVKRGFTINAAEQLKIVWQINDLKLHDMEVVKEQLLGVDFSYVHQLIAEIEKDSKIQKIDVTYIANKIDEIFN